MRMKYDNMTIDTVAQVNVGNEHFCKPQIHQKSTFDTLKLYIPLYVFCYENTKLMV